MLILNGGMVVNMSKKWKILIIVFIIFLVIGFAGKVVIDRFFSMIFLHQLIDTESDLKSTLSYNVDFIMEETDKYVIGEKTNKDTESNENEKEDTKQKNITEGRDTEKVNEKAVGKNVGADIEENMKEDIINDKEPLEIGQNMDENKRKTENKHIIEKSVNTEKKSEENIEKNNSVVSNEEREKQPEIHAKTEDEIHTKTEDKIYTKTEDRIQDEIVKEIVNEIEKTDNTKQGNNIIKINKEKIVKAEKEISTSDKLKALDIILKKLKSSDIEKLIGILKKGKLSEEDINNAKRIIKEKVTEEEKNVLKDLFNKYEYLIE